MQSYEIETLQLIKMFVLVITVCLFIIAKGDKEHFSNYTNAKESCHNRGGLITPKMLKFDGLINITCALGVNNGVLKDGESVWVQGHAQTGPYIALHTCMKYRHQDEHSFARSRTFQSNILYECSVFCDQILHSVGYLGIYNDSCFCMYYSFRFPYTPECLDNDFMDIHNGIIVFRLMGILVFDVQSKSANFNCLGASFMLSEKTSYFNDKCASMLSSICQQRVDSDLSNECLPRLGQFCFIEENRTFLEHYRKCWLYNGTLIAFISGITESLNSSVVLGSFRASKATENGGENNGNATWSCISITQFNGTIYIETENCSNENAFICMDDIQGPETKEGVKQNTDTIDYGLILGVALTVVLLVLVIVLAIWKKEHIYKWILHKNMTHRSQPKVVHLNLCNPMIEDNNLSRSVTEELITGKTYLQTLTSIDKH